MIYAKVDIVAAFNRKSSFTRFFNMIVYTFRSTKELKVGTNHIKELYIGYKIAFSAEHSCYVSIL